MQEGRGGVGGYWTEIRENKETRRNVFISCKILFSINKCRECEATFLGRKRGEETFKRYKNHSLPNNCCAGAMLGSEKTEDTQDTEHRNNVIDCGNVQYVIPGH